MRADIKFESLWQKIKNKNRQFWAIYPQISTLKTKTWNLQGDSNCWLSPGPWINKHHANRTWETSQCRDGGKAATSENIKNNCTGCASTNASTAVSSRQSPSCLLCFQHAGTTQSTEVSAAGSAFKHTSGLTDAVVTPRLTADWGFLFLTVIEYQQLSKSCWWRKERRKIWSGWTETETFNSNRLLRTISF